MPSQLTLERYDVIVVGAGLVGMAAALALSQQGFQVVLLESSDMNDSGQSSYDDRTLVVNHASVNFWKNLGLWSVLGDDIAQIDKVHVSNKGHFGSVLFDAQDFQLDCLANVVEAKLLVQVLRQCLTNNDNIDVFYSAHVTDFTESSDDITVRCAINNGAEINIQASLMLAADGVQSSIRKKLQLPTQIKPYDRTAIVCNITPEFKHRNCAYERLTTTGPTALLPFNNNRCGFVWTVESAQADAILSLSDQDFLQCAQQQCGFRLGRLIKVGQRSSYPLYLVKVPQQVKSRVLLMGSAAHHMSPVSAQGLNLAVRDVAVLMDVLTKATRNGVDIGSKEALMDYQLSSEADQSSTMQYTDDLMSWFAIDYSVVNTLRSVALFAMDQLSGFKSAIFSRASGFKAARLPRLLRKL